MKWKPWTLVLWLHLKKTNKIPRINLAIIIMKLILRNLKKIVLMQISKIGMNSLTNKTMRAEKLRTKVLSTMNLDQNQDNLEKNLILQRFVR